MFAVVHLLNFFTAQKNHVLTHFALDMAVIAAVMWKHCMVEGRDCFPLILITWNARERCYLNIGPYNFFATLICADLGRLRCSLCKWDLFFNWHIVSKPLTELSTSTCSDLFWNCALALIVLFSKYDPSKLRLFKTFLSESESDIQLSMVTHAQNSCSAFTHPSAHTQHWTNTAPWTHTEQWAAFSCGRPGSSWGSFLAQVHLSRGIEVESERSSTPQSWYWGGERALYIHSPHLQFLPDWDRTHNLSITSPTSPH